MKRVFLIAVLLISVLQLAHAISNIVSVVSPADKPAVEPSQHAVLHGAWFPKNPARMPGIHMAGQSCKTIDLVFSADGVYMRGPGRSTRVWVIHDTELKNDRVLLTVSDAKAKNPVKVRITLEASGSELTFTTAEDQTGSDFFAQRPMSGSEDAALFEYAAAAFDGFLNLKRCGQA